MATFRRFEDIEAWQIARRLCADLHRIARSGEFGRDRVLSDHVRRSAISILSNIAEGSERRGTREFARFMAMARGSAGELRAQLYVALDSGHLTGAQFEELSGTTRRIAAMLTSLQNYLKISSRKES